MAVRYYPTSKIISNLVANGAEFLDKNGNIYSGKYYKTYDGFQFSGPNPDVGPSEPLRKNPDFYTMPALGNSTLANFQKTALMVQSNRNSGKPNSFYPQPTEADYKRGYVIRYFTKRENQAGFVIEISQQEYSSIVNGTANYDISMYQVTKILWKITGPLNSQRQSQYNVIPGILETNQRLVESANKTFFGITDYIAGEYSKYARPTQ
jgi:hypothetical protein